jgi:hypothetical protein
MHDRREALERLDRNLCGARGRASLTWLVVGIEWEVVAGPTLRDTGEEDPWEPRQDGGRAADA